MIYPAPRSPRIFSAMAFPGPSPLGPFMLRHSTVRAVPPPQGGALRAKPRRFPLPGAEAQQQHRKWFLPDLRGVNQRLEHGTQRRRMKGYLCTAQEDRNERGETVSCVWFRNKSVSAVALR
jgi:hypothetical protein